MKLEHENAQLKKAVRGARSEKSKMRRIKTGALATAEEQQKTRRERAAVKAQALTLRVEHKVPDAARGSATCGNAKLDPLGDGSFQLKVTAIELGHLEVGRVDVGLLPIRRGSAQRSWSGTRVSGSAPKYSNARDRRSDEVAAL